MDEEAQRNMSDKVEKEFANVHKIKFWTAGIVLVFIYFYRIFISNDESEILYRLKQLLQAKILFGTFKTKKYN